MQKAEGCIVPEFLIDGSRFDCLRRVDQFEDAIKLTFVHLA